eukprot:CAMPEP_0114516876 /NCGR_PEP_ID=MMETSP0109-20121206/17577_1 /TAXON_ID=29199 /ORGANISM="Chlorarachnion reptans, Strain CCCM449" /LENGTH=146 /DNA_ID=CAMNT_0001697325 /DNA_START=235 /DNA_END=676 /DNA_ORIENTATION=+
MPFLGSRLTHLPPPSHTRHRRCTVRALLLLLLLLIPSSFASSSSFSSSRAFAPWPRRGAGATPAQTASIDEPASPLACLQEARLSNGPFEWPPEEEGWRGLEGRGALAELEAALAWRFGLHSQAYALAASPPGALLLTSDPPVLII